jgi:hypothetical protein
MMGTHGADKQERDADDYEDATRVAEVIHGMPPKLGQPEGLQSIQNAAFRMQKTGPAEV